MENKSNVVIEIIKKNNPALFKLLLEKINIYEPYFISSWEFEGRIETLPHTVKTKKIYLSHTGKEGNHALLHDCDVHPGVWWKSLGIVRLLESLNNNTHKEIVDSLTNYSEELKRAIYDNIPTLVRCGTYEVPRHLLQSIVPYNYGYSKEHLECLTPASSNLQFKKTNILKQNVSNNFCSPIHCACINPNPALLRNLLKTIHDYSVGDSLSRKPIHYSVVCASSANTDTLLAH